jgi:hypothetical protein
VVGERRTSLVAAVASEEDRTWERVVPCTQEGRVRTSAEEDEKGWLVEEQPASEAQMVSQRQLQPTLPFGMF